MNTTKTKSHSRNASRNASSGAVYGLGFIGAAVFFISHATSFGMGVIGFLKALVWPAFLVYEAFKALTAAG
ncbi:hypothetical protein [Saccharicrinis sp. FJH54]|uniref:hypothetical protein n=1 Tax=Saccharicrinis sp. FJH54 TaxID=3344665 RepID=UPI0035D46BEB